MATRSVDALPELDLLSITAPPKPHLFEDSINNNSVGIKIKNPDTPPKLYSKLVGVQRGGGVEVL